MNESQAKEWEELEVLGFRPTFLLSNGSLENSAITKTISIDEEVERRNISRDKHFFLVIILDYKLLGSHLVIPVYYNKIVSLFILFICISNGS